MLLKRVYAEHQEESFEYRSYKTYSKQSFLADLVHVNFDLIDEEQDINVAVSKWNELFTNVADFHAPIKKLRTKGIQTPWLTTDLSNAMQDRDYHHRKAVKSNSPFHWMMYKKIKSYVNTNVKKCKAEYYSNLINTNKGNTGALWKTINDISSRKSHSSPSCIKANGVSHTDPKSIAESLNDHFSSIGSKLASKIRNLYPNRNSIKQPSQFRENEFVFQPIEESYVYGVLNNLKTNKAVGLDKISARLLKDSSSVITPILTKLFNRSLISSTFPSTWKSGKVTALFKSGDQSNASNYRPITILPTISTVLEKAVHSQVYRYLIDNKILTPRQFGFRPKLSTEIALAHFTDTILANMDKGLVTGAVFLDLAKAFDTVDHSLLFEKLALSGLSNDSVNWFKSYLTNRNQLTALANTVSSFKHVPVGVPQGSVLGPLLFLIFVNDLPYCINHCEISLYADDTVIYFSSNNACDLENKLNSDLKHLCRWFNDNLLTLNVSKCKFVIYGSSRKVAKFDNVSITVNDSILDRIDSFKYLGVTIQQNLTWSEHIDNISKKFNQRLALVSFAA